MPRMGTSSVLGALHKTGAPRGTQALRYAAACYAAGFLLHTVDHLRRGLDVLTPEVLWAGNVSSLMAVAAIALAMIGHRVAPVVAIGVGFSQAIGVSAVHLLPTWGAFSDSLSSGSVDALSWLAVLSEIAGAAMFGATGVAVLLGGRRYNSAHDMPETARPAG
jgi:hypothetical protein